MMKHVEINIGKVCNSRCLFCYDATLPPNQKAWVSKQNIEKEIDYFFKKGFRSLDFVGGEPTIYPQIIEMVKKAKKTGYERIVIASNSKRFSDFDFTKKIVKAGLNRVTLSIHSSSKDIEDYLTTIPGSFEQKIEGLKNIIYFRDKGYFKEGVSLNPLLHKKNFRSLEKLIIFFKNLGVDNFRFNFIRAEGRAWKNKDLVPSFRVIRPYILRLIKANERFFHIFINFGGIPICMYPKQVRESPYLFKKYYGEGYDLPTDVVTYFIKRRKRKERFNWVERKKNVLETKLPCCKNCKFDKICEGIWKSYLQTYGSKEFSKI